MNITNSTSKLGFWTQYTVLCQKNKICPLRGFSRCLKGTEVTLSPSTLRSDHWLVFLEALSTDNSLSSISLYVDPKKKAKTLLRRATKSTANFSAMKAPKRRMEKLRNEQRIGYCLGSCLKTSNVLQVLKLDYIPLTSLDLQFLADAFRENSSLKVLSMRGNLNDNGIQVICNGLKNVFTMEWIDFSECSFSLVGLQAIISLIKHQSDKRLTEIWEQTLRYRIPDLDVIMGIRRISLNGVKIGNDGAEMLAAILLYDLWIKAFDLQNCDIQDSGATSLKRILSSNCVLEILDLRFNVISCEIHEEIMGILELNNVGKTLKHEWFSSLETRVTTKIQAKKRKGNFFCVVTTSNIPTPDGIVTEIQSANHPESDNDSNEHCPTISLDNAIEV